MAEKRYVVLKDQRYVGKHRTYTEGQDFPVSELFGNDKNISMAIDGAKDKTGKDKAGKEYLMIKGKAPKIKVMSASSKKEDKK